MAKFRIPALLLLIAPVFCAAALMSLAPGGRAGAATDTETGAIADAEGALRVPADYRSMYEYLGTWAVAADHGEGSKQLHNVFASPGAVAAFRANGQLSRRRRSGEGGLRDGHRPDDDGHGQPCGYARWLVRHGQGQQEQPSWEQALGQRMGLVMVRRQGSAEDDIDRLQDGLPALSYSRAGDGLDLHPRVPNSAQVGASSRTCSRDPLTNPRAPRDQSHSRQRAVDSCPSAGMMTIGKSAGPPSDTGGGQGETST